MIRACLALLLWCVGIAHAHPTVATVVQFDVRPGEHGGVVEVRITHDVLAYALNDTSASVMDWQMYDLLEGPPEILAAALRDAHERMASGFRIVADGHALPVEIVRGPTPAGVDAWKVDNPSMRLPLTMEFVLRARIPIGSASLRVRAPHVLDEMLLVVRRPGAEAEFHPVGVAEFSPDVDITALNLPVPENEREASQPGASEPPPPRTESPADAVIHGFRVVAREGVDHQLFVFAMFLLVPLRSLWKPATAFAVATVGAMSLAALGDWAGPTGWLEAIVSASITVVALLAVAAPGGRWWAVAAVAGFGVAHGLSVGSAYAADVAVPSRDVVGVVCFAVGVLAALAMVLAVACLTLGWAQGRAGYRPRVLVPLAASAGIVGLWWTLERLS